MSNVPLNTSCEMSKNHVIECVTREISKNLHKCLKTLCATECFTYETSENHVPLHTSYEKRTRGRTQQTSLNCQDKYKFCIFHLSIFILMLTSENKWRTNRLIPLQLWSVFKFSRLQEFQWRLRVMTSLQNKQKTVSKRKENGTFCF